MRRRCWRTAEPIGVESDVDHLQWSLCNPLVGLPGPAATVGQAGKETSKEQLMARIVHCRRYGENLEGLERPPLPGAKGRDI